MFPHRISPFAGLYSLVNETDKDVDSGNSFAYLQLPSSPPCYCPFHITSAAQEEDIAVFEI